MPSVLKFTVFIFGLFFVIIVFYLLVERKINTRNSFFWLAGSLIILSLSARPDVLEILAGLAGIDYPPTLLFLLANLIILIILLSQSIQISVLQDKVRELTQQYAILSHQNAVTCKNLEEQIKDLGQRTNA